MSRKLPTNTNERTYQPIWEELKRSNTCKISANKSLHKRIVKAVIKEKYNDVNFKLYLADKGQKAVLTHTKKYSIIEFFLNVTIGLSDL